jgi:hypothetical protein
VNVRAAHQTRRWQQSAIVVVAALSLFVSLVAGSALRSQFSAATLPEPAAWSHVTPNGGPSHAGSKSSATIHLQHASSWGISPTNKKPFHSKWMTHNRPDTWPRLQSLPLWFALPASFAGTGSPSGDVDTSALAAERGDQDILALHCVSRR